MMDGLFRNTLGLGSWFVLALIPLAIFALYFLKLKRQPLEVPSTYLWHRVIEDLHVNSFWQRLRKNLLLFLQLLLVALAMLALLRPGWQGESLSGQRFIFLIDNSASMSATDGARGATRLADAKERVAALIEQLERGMSAMIIAFAEQPDVVQEFTDNKRLLRESLQRVEPSMGTTDLTGALALADGFANPARVKIEDESTYWEVNEQEDVELYIFSDGRFRGVEGFSLGNLQPKFLPIGSFEADNMAITALNSRRSEERPELQQAFVKIANFSEQEQKPIVELYLDERLLDASELTLAGGAARAVSFNVPGGSEGRLRARLDIPGDFVDELALDNEAFAVLEDRRDARVLVVTPGNNALVLALSTERVSRMAKVDTMRPSVMTNPEFLTQLQSETYDLMIFDQCTPPTMPLSNTLFIGRMPPHPDWSPAAKPGAPVGTPVPINAPQIIDWQRSHPLLNLVELGNVRIADALLAKPPLGGRVLIDSTGGALMAIAPRGSYEDVVLGFEIVGVDGEGGVSFNTDWPRKHSFPNYWFNVVEYFSRGQGSLDKHFPPNRTVELRVPGSTDHLDVELPDGSRHRVGLDSPGQLAFHATGQLGIYEVSDGENVVKRFAVNLFDREESDVRLHLGQETDEGVKVVDSLSIGYVDVLAESMTSPVRRELWRMLLLGALAVLVVEWYIYNRRVYV